MWSSPLESATIDENVPTSADESIVKFSHRSGSGKKDEKSEPVSVMLSPPKWGPELGEITQVVLPPPSSLSNFASRELLSSALNAMHKVVLDAISSVSKNTAKRMYAAMLSIV